MKDTWYGDHRDLVKWGALVHLARREQISQIVQVAFLRNGRRPTFEVEGECCDIAEEVWAHFRDVSRITDLTDSTGLHITLIDRPFDSRRREEYVEHVVEVVSRLPAPRVVLLDPDTGIEPAKSRPEHVTVDDVERIWHSLVEGDWLVLYQHASRRTEWRDEARAKFKKACAVSRVESIVAPRVATDVAFFAARRDEGS